jgi:hypothetical protein
LLSAGQITLLASLSITLGFTLRVKNALNVSKESKGSII